MVIVIILSTSSVTLAVSSNRTNIDQERAFWDVYRPPPGQLSTTELDIKKMFVNLNICLNISLTTVLTFQKIRYVYHRYRLNHVFGLCEDPSSIPRDEELASRYYLVIKYLSNNPQIFVK